MRRTAALWAALLLAFGSTVAAPATSRAADVGPWHVRQATGHRYQLVRGLTWEAAEAYARSVGGDLVTINDQAEEDWLEATFPQPDLWIGLTDRAVEGTWAWVSGEPVTYTNWCPGQPDDWQDVGGEDNGFMNTSFCGGRGWDDADGAPFDGIVELAGPTTRIVSVAPFVVRWSAADPEAITYLSWNGSPNLTAAVPNFEYPCGGLAEYFGNSWGTAEGAAFVAPVGAGSTGGWAPFGASGVQIASAATGCYGTSGIPVRTSYGIFGGSSSAGRIQVERSFDFGTTPFTTDLRPYIPRLSPANDYSQVLYPSTASAIVTRSAMDCQYGCPVLDWSGTWFAVHDPRTGRGMVVWHETSSAHADLWIDVDAFSNSNATSVVLRAPAGGMERRLVEREVLCFYDRGTWVPSLTPPAGCKWKATPLTTGSKLGLPATGGAYTTTTKVSPLGRYVTWRANLGLAAIGKAIDVDVAERRTDGTWTPFARLTGRVADSSGVVTFSWRSLTARWVSVRFRGAGLTSTGAQARWR